MRHQWWQDAVIYQIYPRSFMDSNGDGIGDLRGILGRLDYLQWLGVDLLWLCPIHPSPDDDNGYDVSDYTGIHPDFGTLEDFRHLLDAAHAHGMRVMLDLVLNHTSDAHPWFQASRSDPTGPYGDWYYWRDGQADRPPNNWASIFGGPAWQFDPLRQQYFLHLFTTRQPDLNWELPAVRAAICAVARHWLDAGVDGFRIDAITHIKKTAGLPDLPNPQGLAAVPAYACDLNVPGILDFIDELGAVFARYDAVSLGEANGVSAEEAPAWVGFAHQRLSMILHFDHWHLWSSAPRAGLDIPALKTIFARWQAALDGRGWNALYIENHDLPRVLARWGDPSQRYASATALAAAYFLQQGCPIIYQGQELGMGNTRFGGLGDFKDIYARNLIAEARAAGRSDDDILAELSTTSRDNSRTPMPWNDGPQAGFTRGTPWLPVNPEYAQVNVASEQAATRSVLHFYRALIALRRKESAFRQGHFRQLCPEHPQIFAYLRTDDASQCLVLSNLSAQAADYIHPTGPQAAEPLLGNLVEPGVAPQAHWHGCTLEAYETRVYRLS